MKHGLVIWTIATILVLVLAASLLGCKPGEVAEVEEAANFYAGKTMRIIVGSAPGGGNDTWARVISPYLEKYTGARVIVDNMPGAGGFQAYSYLFNTAKPDGLTLFITGAMALNFTCLYTEEGKALNFNDYIWLGRLTTTTHMMWAGKGGRYHSWDEFKRAPDVKISVGIGGITDTVAANIAFALALNNPKTKLIGGFAGTAESQLAMIRGEVDCGAISDSSAIKLYQSGDLIPICAIPRERSKLLPDVPTIHELMPAMPKDEKKWVDAIAAVCAVGRGIGTTPKVPKDRVDFLDEAVRKAMHEPGLVSAAQKLKLEWSYLSRTDYVNLFEPAVAVIAAEADEFKRLFETVK